MRSEQLEKSESLADTKKNRITKITVVKKSGLVTQQLPIVF